MTVPKFGAVGPHHLPLVIWLIHWKQATPLHVLPCRIPSLEVRQYDHT